jgi:hypothetical protein
LESREYGRGDPFRWPRYSLYPQKLTLTSPTSGCRLIGIFTRGLRPRSFTCYYGSWNQGGGFNESIPAQVTEIHAYRVTNSILWNISSECDCSSTSQITCLLWKPKVNRALSWARWIHPVRYFLISVTSILIFDFQWPQGWLGLWQKRVPGIFLGAMGGQRINLTTSPPSVSRLCGKCANFDVSQPMGLHGQCYKASLNIQVVISGYSAEICRNFLSYAYYIIVVILDLKFVIA